MPSISRITNVLNLRRAAQSSVAGLPGLMLAAQHEASGIVHGEHTRKKSGSGERFWQFREYQDTDRPQDIDWRQSAKTDRVYIRQKQHQSPQNIFLWCNRGASMNFKSDRALYSKEDAARIITMSLAILFARSGDQVALLGEGSKPGHSQKTLEHIGEALCHNDASLYATNSLTTPLKRGAALFQTGDFLEAPEEIQRRFKGIGDGSLTDHGIIHILDPAEIDLPYAGRGIFENMEEGHKQKIEHIESIREAYQKRIHDHCQTLKTLCRKNGFIYVFHRTDEPIHKTLQALWLQLEGRRS